MTKDIHSDLSLGDAALRAKKYSAARQHLEKAVAGGATQYALNLGWLYETGSGGPEDYVRAVSMYELALPSQPELANMYLGRLYRKLGQADRALQCLEEAARLGNPSAAYWAYSMHADAGRKNDATRLQAVASSLGHLYAQRDEAKESLSRASSFLDKATKYVAYWRLKARGFLLVLKDVNDPRIR